MFIRAGVFLCPYTRYVCAKPTKVLQGSGDGQRWQNEKPGLFPPACQVPTEAHNPPPRLREGSSLPELTVSFLGSSDFPLGHPEDSPNGHDSSQMSLNKQGL